MFFNEMVSRITSRDYNPIFDTDFASLVPSNRFPSLLYGSGATFLKIGLWYGGAASSLIPIFSVYIVSDKIFSDFLFVLSCFEFRQYSLVKIDDGWVAAGSRRAAATHPDMTSLRANS